MYHRRCGKKCRAEQAAFVASKGLVEEFERVSEATHPREAATTFQLRLYSQMHVVTNHRSGCVVHDVER